jgi:hypothetical protein
MKKSKTIEQIRERDIPFMGLSDALPVALKLIQELKKDSRALGTEDELTLIEKVVRHAKLEWQHHYCM